MSKLLKYSVLRHLPGNIGRRYRRRYVKLYSREKMFPKALQCSEGLICIDLGANVGNYTRRMASVAKQVIAFEPDPWAYATLQANVADLDNVRIENAAAGTDGRQVLLYRHGRFEENPAIYSESSSVISSKVNVVEASAVEVRQMDFISFLEELGEDIGLLKIDIEGAEIGLLEALLDRPDIMMRIKYILAETHESRIPDHVSRVKSLRERVRRIKVPCIDLDWS